MTKYSVVGTAVPDVRGVQRVTGTTTYSIDILRPGTLIGRILRSPQAHAEIISIDTSAAESLPGVAAVVTYQDVPAKPLKGYNQYVLDNIVRYVGEEVAAVAAETEEIADEAIKLIKVEYNPLPQVTDTLAAMQPGAPQLFVGEPGNLSAPYNPYVDARGDVNAGFAQADVVFENTYNYPAQSVAGLGQFVAIAEWDGENLTVYDSTQVMFDRQGELAALLNLPNTSVRIIDPYMGGGFGEGNTYRYVPLAALLAIKSGRPVKMLMPGDYIFEQNPKRRHAVLSDVKIGAKRDGTITAISLNATYDKGAYLAGGGACPRVGDEALTSGYRTPNMSYTCNAVYTNNPPNGAYRGYGAVQPNFAVQSAMDDLAAKLRMDPTVLQSMNCIRPDDILSIAGVQIDFGKVGGSCFIDAINKGKAAINWERWTPNGFATSQPHIRGGLGFALLTYAFSGIGLFGAPDVVQVQINSDGTVTAYLGISDIGGGQPTVQAMMIAEQLGAKLSDITMRTGDTNYPACGGQYASKTTVEAGIPSTLAATDAKQKLLNAAAGVLGVSSSSLDTLNSTVVNKATGSAVPFAQIMAKLGTGASIMGTGVHPIPPRGAVTSGFTLGACFIEVNVNTWTGKVKPVKMVLIQDWGQVVNRLGVEGQMVGGALQSLEFALYGDFVKDKTTSQVLSRDWLYYRGYSLTEVPEIVLIPLENPDPRTPFGAKGGGEGATLGPIPAVRNAIANATGLRFNTIPITPQMIIEGLKAKGGAR